MRNSKITRPVHSGINQGEASQRESSGGKTRYRIEFAIDRPSHSWGRPRVGHPGAGERPEGFGLQGGRLRCSTLARAFYGNYKSCDRRM